MNPAPNAGASPAGSQKTCAPDRRYRLIFSLAAICVALDQLCKAAILAWLPLHHGVEIIPGLFNLVHVLNRGAAFGFLNQADTDWQFWLFLLATLLAVVLILHLARGSDRDNVLFCGLGLILGGAVGNLIDRLRFRAVVDFLDVYLGQWHWPAFNVADMTICLGVFLAVLSLWRTAASVRASKDKS